MKRNGDNSTSPDQAAEVHGQGGALLIMAAVIILTMTTWFSASAVIPQLREQWGLSSLEVSLLTIAVQIGFVAGAILSALFNLADVYPARRILLLSALGAAIANAGVVLAQGPEIAIPLRFVTGAFLAGVYPVALKIMSTWYRTSRGVALGVMVGGLTIGSAAPHLVNGIGGLSAGQVILSTSALTLAGAFLVRAFVREGPFPFPAAAFDPAQLGQVFRNRAVRLASIGYFGHMWELYAMWAWFLAFFTDSLLDAGFMNVGRGAAIGTFVVIGIGALGCWLGGILGDRWGRSKTTVAAMAVSGGCSVAIGALFGGPPSVVLLVALIWGIAVVADSAQFSTIVSEVAQQQYVGTALTLQLAVGFTLSVVTIWLVPLLRDSVGWSWTFAFLAPGPAVGIVAMLRLSRLPESKLIAGGRG